eukprot:1299354-Ditylum_brightwellii.AAC.1
MSKPLASTVQNDLLTMLEKMEEDLNRDMEEIQARWAIRSNRYLSMLSNTDASNKKRQQQHQDHDAATRIQRI